MRAAVADHRLVTLTGPIGIGKTRIALAASERWRRGFAGIHYLDGHHAPPSELLAELALMTAGVAARESGPQKRLRESLLIVDHVEDAVAPVARALDQLLDARGDLRVLVVGQHRLGIDGELLVPVERFAVPAPDARIPMSALVREDAVALFIDRVRALDSGYVLHEPEREAVVGICAAADGLPLAIELAAERMRSLSAERIRARLEHDDGVLAPPRHLRQSAERSLQARVGSAFDRSGPRERLLWTAAAVFERGFDLEALVDVIRRAGAEVDSIEDGVTELVDRSILLRCPAPRAPGSRTVRLSMPIALRRFALAAADRELVDRLALAHAQHYHDVATTARVQWFSSAQGTWFERLHTDEENIRRAIDRLAGTGEPADAEAVVAAVAALRYHWVVIGGYERARSWLTAALDAPGLPAESTATGLATLAFLWSRAGDPEQATAVLERLRALTERERLADPDDRLRYLEGLNTVVAGDPRTAARRLDDVVERRRRTGHGIASSGEALFAGALAHMIIDETEAARAMVDECLVLSEASGDLWGQSYITTVGALVSHAEGRSERALNEARAALRVLWSLGDSSGISLALEVLACLEALDRRHQRAASLLGTRPRENPLGEHLLRPLRQEVDRRLADALGEREVRRIMRESAQWPDERVIAFALQEAQRPARPDSRSAEVETLSGRELEVAALIARGMANPAIAAHLVISRRTVEGHVQRILAKLGFSSRTQVAAWFVQYADTGAQ